MKILPIAAMAAATVGCCFAASDWQSEANSRKAELVMIEAQTAYAQERFDDYVLLMDKAYALDSADVDIAGEWAVAHLSSTTPNAEETERFYDLMLKRFYADPTNFPQALLMANVANQLYKFDDNVRIWSSIDSLNLGLNAPAENLARAYLMKYLTGDSSAMDKALAIYDRIEEGTGKTTDLTAMRLTAYLIQEDTAAAVNAIESFYASAPKDPMTALFVGNGYSYMHMDSLALRYYTMACELDSTLGQAYMAKADILYAMGDSVAYDREVFRALHSPNLEVEPKVSILTSYVRELFDNPSQEPRIRELFTDLEQMHTGEASIYDLYGSYLYTIKDYKGAAEQASYSLALNPSDYANWSTLVQMQALASDTTAVLSTTMEAMEKFPEDLYFPVVAAQAYAWREQYDKAIDVLNSVEVKQVNNPTGVGTFYAFKGDVYNLAGDTLQAINAYLQAVDIDPDNIMALNNGAYFMALLDMDLDKAEQMSSRTVRREPNNPTYLDTYAWVLFKKKEYQQAKTYIDQALACYSQPTSGPEADAASDAAGSDAATAVTDAATVPGVSPSGSPDEDEADAALIGEPSAEIYEHAGDIYFMCGEPDKALDFWKKALELAPDNKLLKRKVKHKTFFFK